jgi:hypothetical protein
VNEYSAKTKVKAGLVDGYERNKASLVFEYYFVIIETTITKQN